jgi:hypothetical protein
MTTMMVCCCMLLPVHEIWNFLLCEHLHLFHVFFGFSRLSSCTGAGYDIVGLSG